MDYQLTVYCLAFNHGAYIREALEGFVKQKTNFSFKVIVHDDASTDGTQEIIKEYQRKYPEIIFPILQKENQYSKGVFITRHIIVPMIDTQYTAICEGDDFWTDENKLQLQYDFLQAHPDYVMCVHDTARVNADGTKVGRDFIGEKQDREVTAEEIICHGQPVFHTSSCMYRTHVQKSMSDDFRIKGIGDYPLAIFLATQGRVHYIARTMSAYRTNVAGGWTQRNMRDTTKAVAHYQNVVDGLEKLDGLTEHRYSPSFQKAIAVNRYRQLKLQNKLLLMLIEPDVRTHFLHESGKNKLKIIAKWALQGLKGES